jgi:hypothetical protein
MRAYETVAHPVLKIKFYQSTLLAAASTLDACFLSAAGPILASHETGMSYRAAGSQAYGIMALRPRFVPNGAAKPRNEIAES